MLYQQDKRRTHEPETDSADRAEDRSDQEGATGDWSDASGFADPPIQGSPTPHRGLLADQLYPPDEESHGVRPQGKSKGDPPPDRDSQALQDSARAVDRPEYRALTTDYAAWGAQGYLTHEKAVLSSKVKSPTWRSHCVMFPEASVATWKYERLGAE